MATQGFADPSGRVGFYDPALSTTFATSSLWKTCPLLEYLHDPSIGVLFDWDGTSYSTAANTDWTGTAAVTGSAATSTVVPGAVTLDAGATTANQGFQIQNLKAGFIPAANKSIWFESRFRLTAATPPVTKAQIFVGLAASDTTIIAAGAMTTNNRIGWEILAGGLLQTTFTCDKAGTEQTKTGPLLVSATDIRVGFFYDGVADTIQQYVNGAALGTVVTTGSVPKLVVYPSVACQSDGTDQPNLILQSIRCFQLR